MYEIWSLGQAPFQNIDNAKVCYIYIYSSKYDSFSMKILCELFKVMKHVENGNRLQPPPGCPRHIYSIMIDCW